MSSTETQEKSITSNLTSQILIAMVLGAILGVVIHNDFSRSSLIFSNKVKNLQQSLLDWYKYRTISFTTLVVGIAKLEMLAQWVELGKGFRLVFYSLLSLYY
jgi:Na+/H+-dicarboxylate symporter